MGKKQECSACRFYLPRDVERNDDETLRYQDSVNVCKRYPPIPREEGDNIPRYRYTFPVVGGHQWCGEYQPANPDSIEDGAVQIARQLLLGDETAAYGLLDKLEEIR